MLKQPLLQLLLLITSLLPLVVQARCGTFSPVPSQYNNDEVYTATIRQFRVSALINCTGDVVGTSTPEGFTVTRNCNATNCGIAIPADYVLQINSTLNVTVPEDQKQSLFDLIKLNTSQLSTTRSDINATMFHHIDQAGTCLSQGDAGFWSFSPTYLCVQGTFGECSDSVASLNNQSVTACGVQLLDANSYYGTLLVTRTGGLDPEPAPPNATATITNSAPTTNGAGPSYNEWRAMSEVWGLVLFATAFIL